MTRNTAQHPRAEKTFRRANATEEPPERPNLPPRYPTDAGAEGRYEEMETTRNYEVSQTREHLVVAPAVYVIYR